MTGWAEDTPYGCAGRQLPALLAQAGLTDPVIVTDTITSRDLRPPSMQPFCTMAAVAGHRGVLTADEAQAWLGQLADAGVCGAFFWAVTLIAVGAAGLERLELSRNSTPTR